MRQVEFGRTFIKHYKQRILSDPKLSGQFDRCFIMFKQGKTGPPLNDHALKGKLQGFRAFSVSSDIRVIYAETGENYTFRDIGTHNQVYK